MARFLKAHHGFWTREHRRSLYAGLLLLGLACFIQINAGRYSSRSATNFVGDIFLDNLPTIDVDVIIIQGALIFLLLAIGLATTKPRYILFGLKATAIFIIIRAFFITLTHIGIYPRELSLVNDLPGQGIYALIDWQGNFFFSGHTGMPLLFAFIFWHEKLWRYLFMAVSFLMATAVLLAHVHYSIDVFAAPFMTYCIFQIAQYLFPGDYALVAAPEMESKIV